MKLQAYLEKNRLSTREFAAKIGVNNTQVWRWATGRSVPGIADAEKVKDGTGGKVKPTDFLGDNP